MSKRTYTMTDTNGRDVDVTKPVLRYRKCKKRHDEHERLWRASWDADRAAGRHSWSQATSDYGANRDYYFGQMYATAETVSELLGGRRHQKFVRLAEGDE